MSLTKLRHSWNLKIRRLRQVVSLKQIIKYLVVVCVLLAFLSIVSQQPTDKAQDNPPNEFLPRPLRRWGNKIRKQFMLQHASFFDGAPKNPNRRRIDWHDYDLLKAEMGRQGLGENGTKVVAHNIDPTMQKAVFQANGYNGMVSDMISVNRSLPDIRHPLCKKKLYLAELPTVSVVVPFYNEHFSVLMRTAHSVINRSPPHVLKEIILVNDFSSKEFLWKPLDDYVAANFSGLVRVIHLKSRSGLILARMAGARAATGDVIVFLDSHTEPLINWLPPLIEPIADNYRTCVCPLIDVIDYNNFEYSAQDDGQRGVFDWKFIYKRLPLPKEDLVHPTRPFKSPIMAGGLFAISTKFFWELGGYDEGLDIWGGEQYELSFKIWQCGGQMFDAPCSRVGHIYRGSMPFENPRGDKDFVTKNFKRVAEVWMDEYKDYLYMRKPNLFNRTDAGDLTKQKEIRSRLQCKSFKWFLEEVAWDLIPKFPVVDPEPFAKGVLQSVSDPELCLDTLNAGHSKAIGLYACHANRTHPYYNQMFVHSYFRDVTNDNDECLDVPEYGPKSGILLDSCHQGQGNQFWRYDPVSKMMMKDMQMTNCLDSDPKQNKVFLNPCNVTSLTQKWTWGYVYEKHMRNWLEYGAKIMD